uniref:Ion transport N-terminal domain-containing protein n=1 Tax=Terrapene triunguis TaxID=2587831 RepID=A0A674I6Z8_9SAUR
MQPGQSPCAAAGSVTLPGPPAPGPSSPVTGPGGGRPPVTRHLALLAPEETCFTVFGSAAALRLEQWRVEHAPYCVIHPYSPFRCQGEKWDFRIPTEPMILIFLVSSGDRIT